MKRDTLVKLTTLEYPVTEPFTWPYFGPLALLASIPVLVLLTLLNVATVGHESIAVESSQYFEVQQSWWSKLSGADSHKACAPTRFVLGEVFRTDLGSFDYAVSLIGLGNASSAVSRAGHRVREYGFEYRGAELASTCYSTETGDAVSPRLLSVKADLSTSTVDGGVKFACRNAEGGLVKLRLSHSTKPLTPRDDDYLRSTAGTEVEHFRQSVRVAVDGMAMDLLQSMRFAFGNDSGTALGQVAVYGVMECDGGADGVYSYDCPLSSQKLTVLDARGLVDSAGRTSFIDLGSSSVELPSIPISYGNYLKILAFAHLIDLGVWEGNPLFSPELFNATTDPNDDVSAFYQSEYAHLNATTHDSKTQAEAGLPPYNLYSREQSWAAFLRSPPTFQLDQTLALRPVWGVNYLCHASRIKKPLSLIISVIVADVSLFGALWGVFILVATTFAHRQGSAVSASAQGGQSTPIGEKPIAVALNTEAAQEKLSYDVETSAAASTVSPSFGIAQQ